jgi:tetratricopeptide (TPR) repeat protein
MLETLREFGAERLAAAGGAEEIRRRHARHFLAFAQEAEPHLRRPEQLAWFTKLNAERDNLIAALRFTVDIGDADTAIRLATALAWYWTARGEHATAATWLTAASDLPGDAPLADRAVCLVVGGISAAGAGGDFATLTQKVAQARALQLGDWSEHPMLGLLEPLAAILADDDVETHRLLAAEPGPADPWSRATRHFLAAMVYENDGNFDEYRDSVKKALEGYREIGERWGLATALAAVGSLRLADGDLAGSMAAYDEAHRYMAEITAVDDATYTRTRLATVHLRAGDVERARAELDTARVEAERTGSRIGLLGAYLGLYEVAWSTGDMVAARGHAESALRQAESFSGAPAQALAGVLGVMATLDAEDGDIDGARARIRQAVTLPMADRDMPVMNTVALAAAHVELRGGEPGRAALLFGAALALRGAEDRGSPQVELLRRELRAALGPDAFERAYGQGTALPRHQALGLLRGDPTPQDPAAPAEDQPTPGTGPAGGPGGDPAAGDPAAPAGDRRTPGTGRADVSAAAGGWRRPT